MPPPILSHMAIRGGELGVNAEHVLAWSIIPEGSNPMWTAFTLHLTGTEDREFSHYAPYQIAMYYLPVTGDDRISLIRSRAAMQTYCDKVIPKSAGDASVAWTANDEDVQMGDTDTAIGFEPGTISLETLANVSGPSAMWSDRKRLGYLYGRAKHTGEGTKVLYVQTYNIMVPRGIQRPRTDGYYVWLLTLPDEGVTHNESDFSPAGGDFHDLGSFLDVRPGLLGEGGTAVMGDITEVTRFMEKNIKVTTNDAHDTLKPSKLKYSMEIWTKWAREMRSTTVTANPTP